MKFFWCQGFFFMNFDFKNGCQNQFNDNNKKIMQLIQKKISLTKSISKLYGRPTAMPPAWALSFSSKHEDLML